MKGAVLIVFLLISGLAFGQPYFEITIIGTAHHFKDDYKSLQSFSQVQEFITELSPDIFCIESIPTYDTASIYEIWPNSIKRSDLLRDTIEQYMHYSSNMKNGIVYFAKYDYWNAFYQWYLVESNEETLGHFGKYQKELENSEFGLIIFPAGQKLGIEKFYGVDYRFGEKEFLEKSSKVYKKLLFSFKWKPLKTYIRTQRKYRRSEKKGGLIEFINGEEFQSSFTSLMDDLPYRLPKSEDARFVYNYWLTRNIIMADRIISVAQMKKARNVLVTVGSAHVSLIKRILIEKGHNVRTYGDFINSQED